MRTIFTAMMNDHGSRTASGYQQMLDHSLVIRQKLMNEIHESFSKMMRLTIMPVFWNEYAPEHLVQFRFPRSKKKRIIKKWGKQKSNFRMEKIKPLKFNFKPISPVEG